MYDRPRTLERYDQQYSQSTAERLKELRRTNLYISPRVSLRLMLLRVTLGNLIRLKALVRTELFAIIVVSLGTLQEIVESPERSLRLQEGLASPMS